MYTVIGMRDCTDFIAPDNEDNGSAQSGGISFSASLSDPASTWDFVVDDVNQTINIQNFQPVIVFDENAPVINTIPTVPSMNFAVNGLLFPSFANWSTQGTNGGLLTWTQTQFGNARMIFSNSPVASGYLQQNTLLGYVQAGVKYMFSVYVIGQSPVNLTYFVQVNWLDIGNNLLSSVTMTPVSPPTSQQRVNISGTAPVGAAYAQLQFGASATNATNSGTVIFGAPQFEPMWFVSKGVSYPTPDCNLAQVNSVVMPDGTASRKCRLFAGYVEDYKNFYVAKQRHTAVQCASSSKLLETAGLISASYTNTLDSSILANALSLLPVNAPIIGQLATGQQNFFSPSSTLIAGVTVDSISFNNATPREVGNGLIAQSGSIVFVDPYYYVWYVPPSFVGTTVMLSDTPDNVLSFSYDDFSVEYDSTNPVNIARVQGSKQNAAAITDTFSGDGSTTVFNLTFPPHTVTSVTKNSGSAVRCGVAGVDVLNATIRALINKQNQTITFAVAPVAGANNTLVTYTYEDQVISDVYAADAIAEANGFQAWGLISDSNITSTAAAKNRGLKELTDYASPRTILTLSSLGIYLPVGSLILFTCQSENMANAPFIVQTVDSDLQGGGVYHWNYTAGVYNPTLLDHIRNVSKAVKRTPTTANVVVVASIDVALFDGFVINDSIVVNASGAPQQGPYKYGPDYVGMVKSSAPLRYYRLNEPSGTTATDSGSQAQNGTINGGVTLAQAGIIPSINDTSMLFNGSTGYISVPASSLTAGHDCSIEMWLKIGSFSANSRIFIDNLDNTNAFQIALETGVNGLVWAVDDVTGEVITSKASLSTNTLYHVVAVWNSSGRTVQLYLNGSLAANDGGAVGYGIGSIGTNIGRRTDNTNYFPGTIQGVTLYNFALSSGAISARYNAGTSAVIGAKYGFSSYA